MKFEEESVKTSFEVPDKPTVRWQMQIKSILFDNQNKSLYERLWPCVCACASNWESEILPELNVNILDESNSPDVATVIEWASLQLYVYYLQIENVPKNE